MLGLRGARQAFVRLAGERRRVVMTWHPALSETRRLIFDRIGFLRGGLRLFLHSEEDIVSKYVIQLNEVASFHDSLQRGAEIRISDLPQHGSFGWWLPTDNPHHSIKVSGVGEGSGVGTGCGVGVASGVGVGVASGVGVGVGAGVGCGVGVGAAAGLGEGVATASGVGVSAGSGGATPWSAPDDPVPGAV